MIFVYIYLIIGLVYLITAIAGDFQHAKGLWMHNQLMFMAACMFIWFLWPLAMAFRIWAAFRG